MSAWPEPGGDGDGVMDSGDTRHSAKPVLFCLLSAVSSWSWPPLAQGMTPGFLLWEACPDHSSWKSPTFLPQFSQHLLPGTSLILWVREGHLFTCPYPFLGILTFLWAKGCFIGIEIVLYSEVGNLNSRRLLSHRLPCDLTSATLLLSACILSSGRGDSITCTTGLLC